MDWQEVIALSIVAATALLLVWRLIAFFSRPKNQPQNCGHGCGCGDKNELLPSSPDKTSS